MYKISNAEMLNFFQANNEIKFFYTCNDIVNAGKKDYGIKSVEFYTLEENKPDLEYIEFIVNVFNDLIVYIKTTNDYLIEETCKKITEIYRSYNEIRIGTPYIELMKNDIILKYFDISNDYKAEYGVYALLSEQKLPELIIPDNIEITFALTDDEQKIINLDNNEWECLPDRFKYKENADFILLLYSHNQLAGYLQAAMLYKNIYDIGNVFVHESFRGNGFGSLLTIYYANYCLNNGFIPHYGSAKSKYSENVAVKSGFEEISRSYYFKIATKQSTHIINIEEIEHGYNFRKRKLEKIL